MSSSVVDIPISSSMLSSAEMSGRSFHRDSLMHHPTSVPRIPVYHLQAQQNEAIAAMHDASQNNDRTTLLSSSSSAWATQHNKGGREKSHLTKLFSISLKRMGIVLVAIDFDRTIVATHTRGAWKETPENIVKLAGFVRPSFIDLITVLVENGILVAVVSFSPQTNVIRATLEHVLDADVYNNLFIQCSTPSLTANAASIGGKENHLVAIVSYVNQVAGRLINSREILLIDDDVDNIMTALSFGHYAIHYDEEMEKQSWLDRNIACST